MAFMVEDFGYKGHELGFYVGGLASAFCGAQFCSSVFWGMISDRYGRKVAVISGTFGAALGIFVFGTSKNYWQAMTGRLLSGFLSGNLGVMKCFLAEITDDSNRGKGFSILSSFWNVGCLIAPLAGGLLSNPVEKYPAYFSNDGLFGYYPYLLPCLLCISMNLLGVVMCTLTMTETRKLRSPETGDKSSGVEMTTAKNPLSPKKAPHAYAPLSTADQDGKSAKTNRTFIIRDDGESSGEDTTDDEESVENGKKISTGETSVGGSKRPTLERTQSNSSGRTDKESVSAGSEGDRAADEIDDSDELCCADVSCTGFFCGRQQQKNFDKVSTVSTDDSAQSSSSVLRRRGVVLTTSSYGLLAMGYILFDETIPLFLKLDRQEGGFSFDSGRIGLLVSISAAVMLLFTTFVLPSIASRSKQWLYEVGIIGAIPLTLGWPLLASFNYHVLMKMSNSTMYWLILWGLLLALNILKNMFACFSYTAVMIQINHSAEEEYLGSVNGLGQSLASFARAVGPAIGGILWSFSVRFNFMFLNFLSAIVIFFICGYINRLLPPSIDFKKKRPSDKASEEVEDDLEGLEMMH
jgi:MFS family permease